MPTFSRLFLGRANGCCGLLWASHFGCCFICFNRPLTNDTIDYLQPRPQPLPSRHLRRSWSYDLPNLFRLPAIPSSSHLRTALAGLWPHSWINAVFFSRLSSTYRMPAAASSSIAISPARAQFALPLAMCAPSPLPIPALPSLRACRSSPSPGASMRQAEPSLPPTKARRRRGSGGRRLCRGLAAMLRPDVRCSLALASVCYTTRLRPRSSIPARRPQFLSAFTATAIYSLVALAPIAVWTARNWIDSRFSAARAPLSQIPR